MKKVLSLFVVATLAFGLYAEAKTTDAAKAQAKAQKEVIKAEKKQAKELKKALKNKKDVLKDAEYKEIKTQYFAAEGYGNTYNCKVAKQRFCKVKDLDSGLYVLCDRETSRTQMESAKIFYRLGRCTKLN